MASKKKSCPDCGSGKVVDNGGVEDVPVFRCGHCGQVWQERDGEVEAKMFAEPA